MLCRYQRCARKSEGAWERWDDSHGEFGSVSTAVEGAPSTEISHSREGEEPTAEAGEEIKEDFDWRAELKLMEEENKRSEVMASSPLFQQST